MEPKEEMFTRSVSPEAAPDKATYIEVDFEKGDPIAIDGARLSPAKLLAQLNKVATSGLLQEFAASKSSISCPKCQAP